MLMLWLVTGAVIGTQSASASAWCGGLSALEMITPRTKPSGTGTYFHELLGHPEHQSTGCCFKFAPCHLFPGHLREQSFFFMKT